MRWDDLFADLLSQMDAVTAGDRAAEVAELTRAERASVGLADRVRGAAGSPVAVTVRSGLVVRGLRGEVGASWFLLQDGVREHLVPLHAVVGMTGLSGHAAATTRPVLDRLSLTHALRAVARDRSVVRVLTSAWSLHGRVDAVGADHLDLALVHDDSGRPTGTRQTVTVAALDLVTRL